MALIQLLRMNAPWDRGSTLEDRGPVGETIDWIRTRIDSFNRRGRSRANVAHPYDIGNALYRLFLDSDLQSSCAYWPREIGRASCRESGCLYAYISVVADSLKKK